MEIIKIRDDFIKLGQALKLAGLVESGVDALLADADAQPKNYWSNTSSNEAVRRFIRAM